MACRHRSRAETHRAEGRQSLRRAKLVSGGKQMQGLSPGEP